MDRISSGISLLSSGSNKTEYYGSHEDLKIGKDDALWLGASGAELMDAILGWFPHPSSEWLDPETAEEKSYLDRREDGLMPATFCLGE